jgi:hypothetical protein
MSKHFQLTPHELWRGTKSLWDLLWHSDDRQTNKHNWVPHPLTTQRTRTANRPERRAGDAKGMMGHNGSPISNREGAINPKPVPCPQNKRIYGHMASIKSYKLISSSSTSGVAAAHNASAFASSTLPMKLPPTELIELLELP